MDNVGVSAHYGWIIAWTDDDESVMEIFCLKFKTGIKKVFKWSSVLFIIIYCISYHKLFFRQTNEQQVKECFIFLICKRAPQFSLNNCLTACVNASRRFKKALFFFFFLKKLLCINISLSCREQQKENAIIQICMPTLLNCSRLQYIPQRCRKEGSPLDSVWAACLMHFSKDREVYHWYSGPVVAWAACYMSPV